MMSRRTTVVLNLIALLLGLFLFAGCARAKPVSHNGVAPIPAPVPKEALTEVTSSLEESIPAQRRIIYEADLELVVEDTQAAVDQITTLVEDMGGYVVSASLYRTDDILAGEMTVRVPQERFHEALKKLGELAVRVDREAIHTNDVTQEYVDLEARLKNLEATEKELRALLSEVRKETKSASDIIEIYRELTRVRSEIDQVKARLENLNKLTTYATIRITLTPYELSQPVSSRWNPLETLHRAWRTLLRGIQWLVDLVIYLVVVILPLALLALIPLIILIYLIRWIIRRLFRK
ncbi:MAG: DUF4349 domain-containing protein [Chloroflexi bacterium]|nr:DUF4349 domain-containing protein [Chloroflexota bacterium]